MGRLPSVAERLFHRFMNVDRSRMKAAIYRRYGPPDVVQIADVPRPDLKTKDVLVKVRATTVTAGDSRLRSANVPRGFGIMMRLGFGMLSQRADVAIFRGVRESALHCQRLDVGHETPSFERDGPFRAARCPQLGRGIEGRYPSPLVSGVNKNGPGALARSD